jgi:hypothetical protein
MEEREEKELDHSLAKGHQTIFDGYRRGVSNSASNEASGF